MSLDFLTPDEVVFFQWGVLQLNLTIVVTWVVMVVLVGLSYVATRRLSTGSQPGKLQTVAELVVEGINQQIREIVGDRPERFLPLIGTLFLLVATSAVMSVIPGFVPTTASLSTDTALALCVLVAVPIYGIAENGLLAYLKHYLQPTPLMLPFNIIGELSRTIALAVRLFGNMMSGVKIAAIFLTIAPLFVPVIMQALGLLTGLIQAYIFAILAMVYIASGMQAHGRPTEPAHSDKIHSGKIHSDKIHSEISQ